MSKTEIIFWLLVGFTIGHFIITPALGSTNTALPVTARLVYAAQAMKYLFCECEGGNYEACYKYSYAYNSGDYTSGWADPVSGVVTITNTENGKVCMLSGPTENAEYLCHSTVSDETLKCLGLESINEGYVIPLGN